MMPSEQTYGQRPPNDENLDANIAYLHHQAESLHDQNILLAGQKAAMAAMNPFLTGGLGSNMGTGGLGSPGQAREFRHLAGEHAPDGEYPL